MSSVFDNLHDIRKSDSVQYFSFYDLSGNLLKGDIDVSISSDGQFDTVVQEYSGDTYIYQKGMYTYTTECLYVLGIANFLIPGDIVKLRIDDIKQYELNYGWHTNISGQSIYSWYLKPLPHKDYFYEEKNGIFQSADLVDMNMDSMGILTFYKEYLDTIEVVKFNKDRVAFHT